MSGGNFLTYEEQIAHCKSKGVKFVDISEEQALAYLENNNNYFKLRSFRKNYYKDKTTGKYTQLDFADLIDLAIIDNRLRKILLEMALNVEHFSKVHLLKILKEQNQNGYDIVSNYFNHLDEYKQNILLTDLNKNKGTVYCGNLYNKYLKNGVHSCPVWAFIEVLSFGQYLHFYTYCKSILKSVELKDRLYVMRIVKDIRNACAHNNCIINDIRLIPDKKIKIDFNISKALNELSISNNTKKKHLSRLPVYQIIAVLYAHKIIVTSNGVHEKISLDLNNFKKRIYRDRTYSENRTITATFSFLSKIIDKWYRIV